MSAAFTFAPASERTLGAGEYLLGSLELAAIVLPLCFAAWRLRALLLGGWGGAPARLAEALIALALAIWLSQALGTLGAFTAAAMIAGSLFLAAGTALAGPRLEARPHPDAGPPRRPPAASPRLAWLAALGCAGVLAAWAVPTLGSLAAGMDRADTLWYHMPLSARFLQTGELGSIDFFDPIFFASYYPANSEVLHAIPLLAFERDFLSPLLNLGFLALGLLAAYCVGRPYGVGPQALIGGCVALGAQHLIEFQAGEALNDIVGTSLLLSAVAVLLNGSGRGAGPGSGGGVGRETDRMGTESAKPPKSGAASRLSSSVLALAGVAAGLAAGTKLSFLAPTVALFVGVVAIAGAGYRLRAGAWFALPAFAAGGYWYVRNAVAVGNPIPFTSWGPLGLPAPERDFELRPGFSVAHYWNDLDVWGDFFAPGLAESFGFLWPLTLLAILGAGALAVAGRGSPLVRVLGAVVLFTVLAYLVTPLTAAGEEGEPIAFEWNVRYVAPAAAIALALLPCLPAARASEARRRAVLAGLAVLLIATLASLVQWQQGHVKGAVATGIAVLAGFAGWRLVRADRIRVPAAALAALLAAGALAAGYLEQRHYLERRYENTSAELRLADALRWPRDLRDARVAVSGIRGVFNQYPFYGTDLSNHVQWVGEEGEDGAFLRIPTCERWRAALAAGEYTHVVTTYDPFRPGALTDTKEGLWTRRDPASEEILRDGPVSVFELTGEPDPGACGELPPLSEAELDGDSVNAEPTANQP